MFISGEVITSPSDIPDGSILDHEVKYDDEMNYALKAPVEDAAADKMMRMRLWHYKKTIDRLERSISENLWLTIAVGLFLIFLIQFISNWIVSSCRKKFSSKDDAANEIKGV